VRIGPSRRLLNRQLLKLTFWLAGLVTNPFERPCGYQAHHQKVASTKTGRVLPSIFVFVRTLKGDVEHVAIVSLLAPDARADEAVTDFVNRLVIGLIGCIGLVFHDVLVC
jgi:hypothetical protein